MYKVASHNVNSIRARKELELEWLKREPIDLLGLQELKQEEKNFPFEEFKELGYRCYVFGQKTYNGVALCSKDELDEVYKGFGDESLDTQKRLIYGRRGDIWFINVYVPHGDLRGTDKFHYKLHFYEKLHEFLKENFSPKDKVVLMGDFNVAAEDIDVYDPQVLKDSIGTMPEEREAFKRLLSWGLIDAFRYKYPDKVQYTWWDYIGGMVWKNKGMRIDYILITEPLKEYLRDVYVDMWPRRRRTPKPSDHAPVVAVFEL